MGLQPDPHEGHVITLTPAFKLTLLSCISLSLVSLFASVFVIAFFPELPEDAKRFIGVFSDTWKLGFGAVIGLLGGKVL